MIKKLLFVGLLFSGSFVFSQAFNALYPFSAVTSTSGVVDPTPTPTAVGVSFSSFTAVGVSANSGAGGRFSFSSWGTGATDAVDTYSTMTGSIDLNKYYQAVVTPSAGYGVTISSITFDVRRSGTGIRNFSVRSSADNYAFNLPVGIAFTQTVVTSIPGNILFWSLDGASTSVDQRWGSVLPMGTAFTNFLNPITFRIYAWNAESGIGTFSIDSLRFFGTATLGAGVAQLTHDLNAGFSLYPNPSNDGTIVLETKHMTAKKIEVLNALGSVVTTQDKEATLNEKITLNLNELPMGTYFIRVTTGGKVYTERFFIAK